MKIIDLSMTIEEGMQTFPTPWHPFVEITQLGRHGLENRETRKMVIGTHTGTHIDAPRHFIKNGETVDNLPLETFVGKATVIDCSQFSDFHEISADELKVLVGGRPTTRIVAKFNWDKKLGTMNYYLDHAYFSEEACQWLVESGCKLLALDTPQPDNPKNGKGAVKDAPNHQILLGAGTIIVEYLINLDKLTQSEVDLVVAPLKIKEGDGAPARCFAIEE